MTRLKSHTFCFPVECIPDDTTVHVIIVAISDRSCEQRIENVNKKLTAFIKESSNRQKFSSYQSIFY